METFELNQWVWWVVAVALLVLELLMPGTFFLWPAIAAAGMGIFTLFLPMVNIEYQLMIFSLASIVSVFASRYYINKHPATTDQPFLNQRCAEYIGHTFTLTEAIINDRGRIRIGDSSWSVEGPDCPLGTQVKVISINGTHLKVEPIKKD
jgi:hypothetical protein